MSDLDPRIVTWRRELRTRGRVELGARRWPRRRPTVVVDEHGVRIRPGDVRVPWADVRGVSVLAVDRAPDLVTLVVTEELRERWLAGQGRLVQLLWAVERVWQPDTGLRLPGLDPGAAESLDAFLRHEAERRARLRRGRTSPP